MKSGLHSNADYLAVPVPRFNRQDAKSAKTEEKKLLLSSLCKACLFTGFLGALGGLGG
jgi:hypothetical protein